MTHLKTLRENPSMMLSKADCISIDSSFERIRKIWLARRKAGEEICSIVLDAHQIGKAGAREWLEETQGIEFDSERLDQLKKPAVVVSLKRKL